MGTAAFTRIVRPSDSIVLPASKGITATHTLSDG